MMLAYCAAMSIGLMKNPDAEKAPAVIIAINVITQYIGSVRKLRSTSKSA